MMSNSQREKTTLHYTFGNQNRNSTSTVKQDHLDSRHKQKAL